MRPVQAQTLICAVITFSFVAARNMQTTTPRYNNNSDETVNLQNVTSSSISEKNSSIALAIDVSQNSSYLPNVYIVNDTGSRNLTRNLDELDRSRKLRTKTLKRKVDNAVSASAKITRYRVVHKNQTNVNSNVDKKKVTIVSHVGNSTHIKKPSRVSTTTKNSKPKVKHKTVTPKPSKSSKLVNSRPPPSKKTPIKKDENSSSSKKKVVVPTKPPGIFTISKLKLQNLHYKNYTKFRIKPSNKQAIEYPQIYPEISTYSPEFPIGGAVPQTLISNAQSNYPQINPIISTYSPQYSIADATGGSAQDVSQIYPNPVQLDPLRLPMSQVILQSLPSGNTGTKDGLASDCPSFSVSSNVFGPQRQGCSDLSVVMNSYMNQNTVRDPPGILPNDGLAAGDPLDGVALDAAEPAADETAAAPSNAAAPAAPSGGSGGSGGSPGGGLPQLPGLPELGFPDLKGLFDLLGGLWRIVSKLFGFLANPYLYLVPAALSFGLGFLKVMAAFKLFVLIPGLLWIGYIYRDRPPEVIYYNHIHKPVHHYDGWYYNHNTKSWQDVGAHSKGTRIPKLIREFEIKYQT